MFPLGRSAHSVITHPIRRHCILTGVVHHVRISAHGGSRKMDARRQRSLLQRIAHRAMIERGLLPDFSRAALAELDGIRATSPGGSGGPRDLRNLPWASIDNDDSRDLDQLTVAEAMPGGAVKILVADRRRGRHRQEGLGDRRSRPAQHHLGLHRRRDLPDASREAVDRPHVARLPRGSRWPSSSKWSSAQDGSLQRLGSLRCYGPQPRKARLQQRCGLAGRQRPRPGADRSRARGWTRTSGSRTGWRNSMKAFRHEHGALDLETIEARPVFDGDEIRDLEVEGRNRAKELIEDFMIAANGVTARYPRKPGSIPPCGAWSAPRSGGSGSSKLRPQYGATLPPEPDPRALVSSWQGGRPPILSAFPTSRSPSSS